MADSFILFTLGYILLSLGLVFPPPEFAGFGLTLSSIFRRIVGDEDVHFVKYHMMLTAVTLVSHLALLPIYYFISWYMFNAVQLTLVRAVCSLAPVTVSLLVVLYWWYGGSWEKHPLSKVLAAHAPRAREWPNVANALSTEFRRVDKFVHGSGWGKIVVTENWVVKCGLYWTDIAYQPDIHLSIQSTEQYKDTAQHDTQYVRILVSSINPACSDFIIRLNTFDYGDLKDKITAPILNVRNVVFQQSISERFELAFREQVLMNERWMPTQPAQECIGCLYAPSDVKLQKLCERERADPDCVSCLCRPMWCMRCVAKWFASRQEQNRPENWLSGTAPCPTCRSVFCIRDVCPIVDSVL